MEGIKDSNVSLVGTEEPLSKSLKIGLHSYDVKLVGAKVSRQVAAFCANCSASLKKTFLKIPSIMRLSCCAILCFIFVIVNDAAIAKDRATRALTFRKGSSFFYRVNYKITSFRYTTIFAQAAGFKLVWELPSGRTVSRRSRSVEDVHQAAELVYESHGFDGRSCLLKNICQAMEYVSKRDGVIAKILRLLVGSYANNGNTSESLYCDAHARNCPLELIGIDSFTEQ